MTGVAKQAGLEYVQAMRGGVIRVCMLRRLAW